MAYNANYPKPSSWNTYGIRVPSQYHTPTNDSGTQEFLNFDPVDGSKWIQTGKTKGGR